MAGKGNPKTGGRSKGTPNKVNRELKEMILQALSDAGGIDYLKQQAKDTPTAFLSLVGKVLPLQVSGEGGGALVVEIVKFADKSPQ